MCSNTYSFNNLVHSFLKWLSASVDFSSTKKLWYLACYFMKKYTCYSILQIRMKYSQTILDKIDHGIFKCKLEMYSNTYSFNDPVHRFLNKCRLTMYFSTNYHIKTKREYNQEMPQSQTDHRLTHGTIRKTHQNNRQKHPQPEHPQNLKSYTLSWTSANLHNIF